MSYQEMRALALEVSAAIPESHPCVRGNGACCDQQDIAMVAEDLQVISEGVRSGEISSKVIERGIENMKDPERTACPLFDIEEGLCTVYNHRPMACIIHGAADMCNGCFVAVRGRRMVGPSAVDKSRSVETYIGLQNTHALGAVVIYNFPQLLNTNPSGRSTHSNSPKPKVSILPKR